MSAEQFAEHEQWEKGIGVGKDEEQDLEELADEDHYGMVEEVLRRRRGQAVPPWSAPRVAWRAVLKGGTDEEADRTWREWTWRMCWLCRRTQTTPLQWCASWTCLVDKRNSKIGCKRWRRLEIFDPLSQAWGSALWKRQRHQFAANQFAYNAGRCRAHAIMTIRLQRWRYSAGSAQRRSVLRRGQRVSLSRLAMPRQRHLRKGTAS